MEIATGDSGCDDAELHEEVKRRVRQALTKVNPNYVALFEKIGGKISVEEIIYGGNERTLGMCRFPMDIAIKSSELLSDDLDRTLTEEIIHYLDYHLKFSDNKKFQLQKAADIDAQNPLSLAMLIAVRGGTKGMTTVDAELDGPNLGMMIEFSKQLPFLGVYHDTEKTNKYEWLAEVEHAEQTLSKIADNSQAHLLFTRAQKNMPEGLIMRFLSNHGINFPAVTEAIIEEPKEEPKIWADFLKEVKALYYGKNFTGWVEEMASKVDVSDKIKTDAPLPSNEAKINLAFAYHLLNHKQYPLSEMDLRKTMVSLFPESYYALRSFRDEVDRELQKLNRADSVREAIELVNAGGDLRKHLSASDMDEVALRKLASTLHKTHEDIASAIDATLNIQALIKNHRAGEDIPRAQIATLLETAWSELPINGRTIMQYTVERELYEVSDTIARFMSRSSYNTPSPPH